MTVVISNENEVKFFAGFVSGGTANLFLGSYEHIWDRKSAEL